MRSFCQQSSRLFNGSNRQLTPPIIANKNSQFTQLAVAQQRNVFRRSPCIKCLRSDLIRIGFVLNDDNEVLRGELKAYLSLIRVESQIKLIFGLTSVSYVE